MKVNVLLTCMLLPFLSTHSTYADTFGDEYPFEIEFVTVGHPNNPDNGRITAGKVEYPYRIGKHEISRGMIDKANREGNLNIDAHPDRSMEELIPSGVRDEMAAGGITWFEAMKFVNWLNASQGYQPAYNVDLRGDFQLWGSSEAWQAGGENLFRHKDAHYFLPSVDEWYKAAFYDSETGSYFRWTTGNTRPTAAASGTAAGTAVFNFPLSQGPADITLAGGLSGYGTMGQGGNVFEWVETEYDLVNDSPSGMRDAWGGWWGGDSPEVQSWLSSTYWGFGTPSPPTVRFVDFGFRVASVPEPHAMSLMVWASTVVLFTARIRSSRRPRR